MSESELRPIGTEFKHYGGPWVGCSNVFFSVITYRIIAYSQTDRGATERLECIEYEKRPVCRWIDWFGSYYPVPDQEVTEGLGGEWLGIFMKSEGLLQILLPSPPRKDET